VPDIADISEKKFRNCVKHVVSHNVPQDTLSISVVPLQTRQVQQTSAVVDEVVTDFDLQPVGPRSAEAFQQFDVVAPEHDLRPAEHRSLPWSHNCADVAHHHASPPDAQRSVLAIPGFWAIVCKTVHPMLSDRCQCLSVLSVTLAYCGQTVGWIKMKLGMHAGRPHPRPHCARMGPSSPPPKGGSICGPYLL